MIDTHCHLSNERYDNVDGLVKKASAEGVKRLVTIGVDLKDSLEVVNICKMHDSVYGAVGVHPVDVAEMGVPEKQDLLHLATSKKIVALGETGLDLFHGTQDSLKDQEVSFARHAEVAHSLKKAMVIHSRNAFDETKSFLKDLKVDYPDLRCVVHCFTGDLKTAMWFIEHCDAFISFSGIVTFEKKAELIQEAATHIPLEYLLCETDAPYLAPQKIRGQCNEPYAVRYVYEYIAQARGLDLSAFKEHVAQNAERLFHFKRVL